MDRPTMPPAHRDLPDDVTPPGHEPVKYVVGPGDLTRGELRRLLADAGAKAAELSNLSRDDLVSVAKARKLEGLEVSGTGAVEARARDFLRGRAAVGLARAERLETERFLLIGAPVHGAHPRDGRRARTGFNCGER